MDVEEQAIYSFLCQNGLVQWVSISSRNAGGDSVQQQFTHEQPAVDKSVHSFLTCVCVHCLDGLHAVKNFPSGISTVPKFRNCI